MAKRAIIAAAITSVFLIVSACGLSAEERMRLSLNRELIPRVPYKVYEITGGEMYTVPLEVVYDRASGQVSGPFVRFQVPAAGSQNIVDALSGEGGADELMLFFSENQTWNTDEDGFYFTSAEALKTREEKGKTIVSMVLKPLEQVPMDDLRGRNEMIWFSGTLLQAAANCRKTGVLGEAGVYSPFWVIRTPSRKRAHVVLLDDGKSLQNLLYIAGAVGGEPSDF